MPKLSNVHTEHVFENELTGHLAKSGWAVRTHLKDAASYNRELALFPDDILAFVQETQPAEWAKFKKWHNGDSEKMLVKRVAEQLDKWGMLHVLRKGFKDRDAKFFLCQLRPANRKNPQLVEWYGKNRLTCVRQLRYSVHNENSIDLVFFVNGLPVGTAELKTDTTQNIEDAILQYRKDRVPKDPKSKEPEPLLQFKTRALVHFAVSTEQVFMTTKLEGDATRFLPFNLGKPDGLGGAGAGNPPAPDGLGYPTWYFWHLVLNRDAWLAILGSFLHLERKDVEVGGKVVTKETLIFPRYHQLDGVFKLVEAAASEGAGHSYLIQHSAGSGKSNSIAWTAHWLANLHNAKDEKVFHSVIVITDRRVLDRQLQETISQFEHKAGVVQKIDQDSEQLAGALNDGVPIVVTTLQKFPYVLDKVGSLKDRRFALIVDEAHSSQTGSAAQKLNQALTSDGKTLSQVVEIDGAPFELKPDLAVDPEDITSEDVINTVMASRKRPGNVSYFAFTATPKAKTLELFGRPGPNGVPGAFHVYSMRQAIEEGFILDVLKHYTSYQTFYKLGSAADEKLVPQLKAKKALAKFAQLHSYNIAQKVVVIVEHFREHVMPKIGGRAKAMVVTSGRQAAVRYKLAMDKYIAERKYADMKTLVAFSGDIPDPESGPDAFNEANLNPDIKGAEPAEAFKDDRYRVLLVANKYQTGFDQPLLHTMYVDKRLSGVMAVQTLSRLNRTFPGKEDTFVLDFVNKPDEILKSFQPFYRTAELEGVTDPNIVHELQTKLDQAGVYLSAEVEKFAEVFFDPKRNQAGMHQWLKPAGDRFEALDEDAADQFRKDLGTFLRMYDFLSQIIAYNDAELEKLYAYGKNLMPRIADHHDTSLLDLNSDVRLTHYRLQKQGEQTLDLSKGEVVKLKPASEAGTGKAMTDEEKKLAEVVEKMNDLFSGDLSDADFVGWVTTINGNILGNQVLADQAANNTAEQFELGDFKDILMDIIIESKEKHNHIADQLLKDEREFSVMCSLLAKLAYSSFASRRGPPEASV
ncbi:MAG: type I restriction endonuclease [Burkholderiales bacterium]